MTKCNEER